MAFYFRIAEQQAWCLAGVRSEDERGLAPSSLGPAEGRTEPAQPGLLPILPQEPRCWDVPRQTPGHPTAQVQMQPSIPSGMHTPPVPGPRQLSVMHLEDSPLKTQNTGPCLQHLPEGREPDAPRGHRVLPQKRDRFNHLL